MNLDEARKRFDELRRQEGRVDPKELDEIWSAIETVRVEDILGDWKGSSFDTGHSGTQAMTAMRWHGKKFNSAMDAKPLIRYDESGNLFSDTETGKGEASLWMVEFRGEVTATMVYDGRPIFDHFKKVNDSTLFGIMNGKEEVVFENGRHFYFILDRA